MTINPADVGLTQESLDETKSRIDHLWDLATADLFSGFDKILVQVDGLEERALLQIIDRRLPSEISDQYREWLADG